MIGWVSAQQSRLLLGAGLWHSSIHASGVIFSHSVHWLCQRTDETGEGMVKERGKRERH